MQDPDTSHLQTAAARGRIGVSDSDFEAAQGINWMGVAAGEMDRRELLGFIHMLDGYVSRLHGDRTQTNAMNFGQALSALKAGAKVARAGWNGKGMWIALTPGSAFEARHAKCGHAAAKRAVELDDPEGQIELLPHIDMRAADGCMVVGWLASQTDMLADDWQIVP
jgi:hypothetical protein